MKAVRFLDPRGEVRIGSLSDHGLVLDAGPSPPNGFVPSDANWRALQHGHGPLYLEDDVEFLPPVVPGKIIAVGLNYRDHAYESDLDVPPVPVVFAKFPSALVGHRKPIVIPREETRADYEGELAVVIGRRTYRADPASALRSVGGITAFNDVSGRRAQLETPLRQFTLGKSFDTFAPMGPCIRSVEDLDVGNLGLRTILSGEVVQDANTRLMIFSVVDIIVYCSAGITLEPGDVIATGTPGGVGDTRTPPRYLREGDVVEVWVEGVGTLRNPVVQER